MSDFKDRVKDTTTTTGTGTVTLANSAPAGHRTFGNAFAAGVRVYYTIVSSTGSEWEVGHGTLVTSTTLARTTILSSSNGGAAVNFSAGTKDVICSIPAATMGWKRFSNVPVSHTGDTLETTLATVTIPGGLLQANSVIEIEVLATSVAPGFVNAFNIKFGGTTYATKDFDTTLVMRIAIYCNNSITAQKAAPWPINDEGLSIFPLVTSAVNTANDVAIIFTAQNSENGTTAYLQGYRINIDI